MRVKVATALRQLAPAPGDITTIKGDHYLILEVLKVEETKYARYSTVVVRAEPGLDDD